MTETQAGPCKVRDGLPGVAGGLGKVPRGSGPSFGQRTEHKSPNTDQKMGLTVVSAPSSINALPP